jgi:hypothetical protein
MVVEQNPQSQCPGEYDLQLDLTLSGTTVTGTAITRLRKVIGAQCQDVLGEVARWSLFDGRIESGTLSFNMGSGGSHRFSGTVTATRITGTFSIIHTVPRATTQTGSFAVNRQ